MPDVLDATATTGADAQAAAHALQPTPDEIAEAGTYRTFGMTDAEYERACTLLGRRPTYTEVGMVSVLWSEHCSYKSTRHLLRTLPTDGPHVLQGPGENAGVVDSGHGPAIAFKIESHNHPSAVEPYQGAATGVGGILRDVWAMGARPVALLDSLRFGPIDDAGRDARNRYLFGGVVAGIAGYGNCIGVPTVGGEVVFDEAYRHNPLVNAMCVGTVDPDAIATAVAGGVGNPVLAFGARTGRDGIHGATFASVEDPLSAERSAVQIGDPFLGKLVMEVTLELLATGTVVGMQDMGAAGLTSSSAEMAARSTEGVGIELELARLPLREAGMTAYEAMLSESQERMLCVVEAGTEHVAEAICARWGVECATVGRVTDDGLLRVRELDGSIAAELPVALLVDEAPRVQWPAERPASMDALAGADLAGLPEPADLGAVLRRLLARPTIASKAFVFEQYDHMVQAATAVCPGSDAAVVLLEGTDAAIAMTTDGNGRHVRLDPRIGTQAAVAEAARNLVCSGARPLAVTNCLNFGSPEDPGTSWQLVESVAGMGEACRALGTPVVGGNVSLYNGSDGQQVHPTPVIGMVGIIDAHADITTQAFTAAGSAIVLVGPEHAVALDGSEYLAGEHDLVAGRATPLDLDLEVRVQATVLEAIRAGHVRSAHDCSDGGMAVALAEQAIAGGIGAAVQLATVTAAADAADAPVPLRHDTLLFGEGGSRILLEVHPAHLAAVLARCVEHEVPARWIGMAGGDTLRIDIDGARVADEPVADLASAWKDAVPSLMS